MTQDQAIAILVRAQTASYSLQAAVDQITDPVDERVLGHLRNAFRHTRHVESLCRQQLLNAIERGAA
jgi:hypothetical protein